MKAPHFMGTRVRLTRRFVRPLRPVRPMQPARSARITRKPRRHCWLYALNADAPLHVELTSPEAPACILTPAGIDTVQQLAERERAQAEEEMNEQAASVQDGGSVDEADIAEVNRRWIKAQRRINLCEAYRLVNDCRVTVKHGLTECSCPNT